MSAAAIAILIRKENDLITVFQRAGATSPDKALATGDLMIEPDRTLRRLRERAVIRESGAGRLYLDQPTWDALHRKRRRTATAVVVIALIIAVGLALSGGAKR